jgi:hypothetical protein
MRLCFLGLAAATLLGACSNDDGDDGSTPGGDGPLYVMATAVSDDSASNTYVALLDSLAARELDLSQAREFPGWSDIGVIGGWVFVSSGEAPVVTRFALDAQGTLVEDGPPISFANYVGDANMYNQELISPTKAYLLGDGELVVWNPTTLEITGTVPLPKLPVRDGIEPYVVLDRGSVVRGDRMYVTAAWTDTTELNMLPDSRIIVVDVERDVVVDEITVPCPDVMVADGDEHGNLYFSNWVYSPGATLLYGDSPACAVRIPAGSETIDDWRLSYAGATGHEGAAMGYLGSGRWLFSSFLGDPATYDPATDDWFDWLFGDSWQLTVLDPSTGTTTPVTGIPRNGGGYYASRFDGVTHLLMPGDGYTTTSVFALGADGVATPEIHSSGWSTRIFRLR